MELAADDGEDVARFRVAHEEALGRPAVFQVLRLAEPVELGDAAAVREVLTRFAERVSGMAGGAAWQPIEEPRAREALDSLLRFDQAYGTELVEPAAAAALIAGFVELIPAPRSWYTLASFSEREYRLDRSGGGRGGATHRRLEASGWYGILLGATFDTGLVALSARRLGALWFADED